MVFDTYDQGLQIISEDYHNSFQNRRPKTNAHSTRYLKVMDTSNGTPTVMPLLKVSGLRKCRIILIRDPL